MLNKFKNLLRKINKIRCRMSSKKWIDYLRKQGMTIGEGTTIFSKPMFLMLDITRPWMIEIGRNVQIARDVKMLTHDYSFSTVKAVYGDVTGSCGKIKIGDNCFIGMGAIILKDTTIGDNVIVGAGSIVCGGEFPSNCVIAGNPARVVCSLEEYRKKRNDAQLDEAKSLVEQYIKIYKKTPDESVLNEFFWLFSPRNDSGCEKYRNRLSLMNNYELSLEEFMNSKPYFDSYDDFIKWATNEKEA